MSVDVVIPAHNEADTIGDVLVAVAGAPSVGSVIVVANGCTDDTAAKAGAFVDVVVEIPTADKGSAMVAGLANVTTEDVLFIDGDLGGLKWQHVEAMATYAPAGGMVIGVRDGFTSVMEKLLPPISGTRRLPADFARRVNLTGEGYKSEILIDAAVGKAKLPHHVYVLVGVTNPTRAIRSPLSWAGMWVKLAGVSIPLAPELVAFVAHPD